MIKFIQEIRSKNPKEKRNLTLKSIYTLLFCLVFGVSWVNGQTNPAAFALSGGSFTFTTQTATNTAYPTNMQGWTTGTNNITAITTAAPGADQSLVASGSASTSGLSNLGSNGFNFLPTSSSPNRQVGAICVSLNTTGRSSILVSWLADDQTSGSTREMNISLQYRIGTSGTFTDVSSSTYTTSNNSDKASQSFSNIALPGACENQSVVQIRWITYESASQSGSRDAIRLDEITISSSVGSSSSSNIILNTGFTHPTNIDYTAYQAASGLTTGNSIEVGRFDIQDGGGSSDADALATTLTACSLTVANSANIRALALFDGSTNVGEITSVGVTAAFSGLTLAAADNGSKTFSVRATFKSAVTDNQQISFTVASATASGSGSGFAAANAGAAATSTTGDNNRIEVATTDIIFDQNVSTVSQNAVMNPSPTVRAIDGNANYDLDNTSNVVLTIASGSATFDASATTTVSMVAGVATFSNLIFSTAANTNTLTATQGATSDASSSFNVTASAPEINVKQNVTSLASGSGSHAAGSIVSGNSGSAITFTIENLGSANLTYSSISNSNTTDFTLNTTSTSSPIAASGTTTFTVAFNPTTAGAKSTTITINNNDADEGTYTFTVTGTGTVSSASNIITNSGYTYNSNIDYASFQTASTLTTGNSVGVAGLTIQDGAGAADADNLGTTLTAISFTTGGSTAIRTAALFDGSINVSEVAVNGATTISFSGLTLSASDASTKNFELRVTYQASVTDNQQITFTVSSASASATTSGFAAANAGGAVSTATSDINRLEVTATSLAFVQQVSNVSVNTAMTSAPTVSANDVNGNRDLDYVTNMTATTSGTFAGGSTNTVTPSAGLGTFNNLQFSTAALARTIDVGSGILSNSGNSNTFNIFEAQPTVQASAINFTNVGMNSMTINWTNGDGANRIVVVKATGTPGTSTDGVTYTANTIMGSGSTFGTSEFVVYNGTGNTVDITNLLASTTYSVKVFEYNGSAGTENYLTTSNNTSQTTSSLTYYSNGSGDPAVLANWKTERNGTGSSPSNFISGEVFVIENGDIMTTTSTWSISGTGSKLQIENGGTLTANNPITLAAATTFQIDNGGTYIHNNLGTPSTSIFTGTESFGATSNFRIDNWINNTTVITTGVTLPYGNLEINYTSNSANWQQGLSGTINLTAGNLTITSVGTGSIRFAAATAPTLSIAGNFTQTAGIVNLASTSAGSSVTTLNVGGNFAVNGGTFTSSSTGSKVVFNKSGSQTFTNAGTISTVNFEVGASSILDLGTSVLSGGSFTIPSGATLKTAHASGISGAITATTKSFSSAANYEFNGASTGTFTTTPTANTVNNLTINRGAGVTLSQNLAVAGALTQTDGKLSIGVFTLTLNGTYSGDASNSLTGSSSSNLSTNGFIGTLYFDQTTPGTTNALRNLTISGSGTTTLSNTLNITGGATPGIVTVGTGATLTTDGNLTLKSDASGTAIIANSAGTISGNITVERYIPGGASRRRTRFLASPVVGGTALQWRNNGTNATGLGIQITGNGGVTNGFDVSNNTNNPASAWTYTQGATISSGGSNGSDWTGFTTGSMSLTNGQGYRVLVRGDRMTNLSPTPGDPINTTSTNTTISVTGTYPGSSVVVGTTRNSTFSNGWNLVGNPYPSPINWSAVTKGSDVDASYWVYNPSSGSYASHNGSTGTASNLIASGQGFFVRRNSGTTGSLGDITFNEASKTTGNGHFLGKSQIQEFEYIMKYDSNNYDGNLVVFDANYSDADDNFDTDKLSNASINICTKNANGRRLSINSLKPVENEEKVIPIDVSYSVLAKYTLEFARMESLNNIEVLLKDKFLNKTVAVTPELKYAFELTSDTNSTGENRFEFIFRKSATGLNNELTSNNNFIVFPNPANNVLNLSLTTTKEDNYSFTIFNQLGEMVNNGSLDFNSKRTHSLNIENLNNGVYFIQVKNGKSTQTIKFIK